MAKRTALYLAGVSLLGLYSNAFAGVMMASGVSEPRVAAPHFPSLFALPSQQPGSIQQPDGSATFLGRLPLAVDSHFAHADASVVAPMQAAQYFQNIAGPRAQGLELAPTATQERGQDVTTYFVQTVHGVPVEGTYAMAVVQNNTLHYARHYLIDAPSIDTVERVAAATAEATAVATMAASAKRAFRQAGSISRLAVVFVNGAAKLAWKINVSTESPWALRAVFVDAHDGSYLTYKKLSRDDVAGSVNFDIEPACVGDEPVSTPMPHIMWNGEDYTDVDGKFAATGAVPAAKVTLESPYVDLTNDSGDLAGPWSLRLADAPADNEMSISDAPLDQVDAFYHVHRVRAWLRSHVDGTNSQTKWSDKKLSLRVNIQDTCNAYYDGGLNFFSAGDGCLNTGRTAGIIYHEYGHGIHDHSAPPGSGGEMDGQVSEGIADYIAASITGNPNMRGIFSCHDNFRSCVNTLTYCEDGCDMDAYSEVHDAGQVICAVWWEIHEQLVARYGETKGTDKSDRLHLKFLTHVGNMYSAYAAAIAADDDKDNDPSNGTTHSCEINKAFSNTAKGAKAHFPGLKGMVPCNPNG